MRPLPIPVPSPFRPLAWLSVAGLVAVPALAAVPMAPDAAAPSVAAPGAEVRSAPDPRRTALRATGAPVSRRIDLGLPSGLEAELMTARNRRAAVRAPGDGRGQPLAIGYPRAVARTIPLRDLAWTSSEGSTRVARVELASGGARALRIAIALDMPAGADVALRIRVASPAGDVAYGAYTPADLVREAGPFGAFWTPVVDGDTAVVEIEVPANADLAAVTLRIPRLAHLVVGGGELQAPEAPVMRASGIGSADACNVDAACTLPGDAALQDLARSVAKLVFVGDDGISYVCSGTLLNDTAATNTPYLFTADHCIDSATVARTVSTFWFYSAVACNSKVSPPFVQLTGGGTLLGRSQDNDWSFLRLNATPPAGTRLASWRAEAIAKGAAVVSLHHPSGDLLKVSQGSVTGSLRLEDDLVNAEFTQVVWSAGITEGGSSGGLLATRNGTDYEVRGGLYGGLSVCSRTTAPDYFSRLETALPLMRQYLTPGVANPGGVVVAVEFYNAKLDHYFLSTNPVEIDNLDSGRTVGWVRTGLRFLAHPTQVPGTNPVCRFYRAPEYGDSHFYSASPEECAQTAAAHPVDWVYESPSVFYVALPDVTSGSCPAGTTPVYRYFNTSTTNHRYTADRVINDRLRTSPAWTAEGYGPGPSYPAMCAVLQ